MLLFWNLPHEICVLIDEFVQGQLKKDLKNMDMQALAEALDDLEFAQDLPWTCAEIKAKVQAKPQEALQLVHLKMKSIFRKAVDLEH